jgi:UDP-N-acetylmuramoyl-L-alanyl-D-glutamate--2,6-diaminopimelate ligase
MARAAAAGADALILTADNSRSEATESILEEIRSGLPGAWREVSPGDFPEALEAGPGGFARVPDRAAAIRLALFSARPGDAVVIAGKGHETTQTIGSVQIPFDDRAVAREALAERASRGGRA